MIYVIQATNGWIKIGYAADPHLRFKGYLGSSPLQLRLVAILPGERREEADLHARFDDHRQHCEWFEPGASLIAFVNEIWGQGLDAVPDWVKDYKAVRAAAKEQARTKRSESHKRLWAIPGYREGRARERAWFKSHSKSHDAKNKLGSAVPE